MNYTFDIQGDYSLEGRAFFEDTEHSVIWQVAVNSVLYWWRPHERLLETEPRQEIEFSVIPFNPDSDSLDYLWLIDDEDDGDIEDGIFARFNDVGEHHVTAIVHDGAEVDTVIWTVMVVEENAVDDDRVSLLPTEVTLYPAAPNPFNSTTTIRYFLPRSVVVRLTVGAVDCRGHGHRWRTHCNNTGRGTSGWCVSVMVGNWCCGSLNEGCASKVA